MLLFRGHYTSRREVGPSTGAESVGYRVNKKIIIIIIILRVIKESIITILKKRSRLSSLSSLSSQMLLLLLLFSSTKDPNKAVTGVSFARGSQRLAGFTKSRRKTRGASRLAGSCLGGVERKPGGGCTLAILLVGGMWSSSVGWSGGRSCP